MRQAGNIPAALTKNSILSSLKSTM